VAPIWAGLASLMAGVRRISTKTNPARVALKRVRSRLRKGFRESRALFFRAKGRFIPRRVALSTSGAFYRTLWSRGIKAAPRLSPQAHLRVPLENPLGPLASLWSRLGFNFHAREGRPVLPARASAFAALARAVATLERAPLLLYGGLKISARGGPIVVTGALSLGGRGGGGRPTSMDGGSLVLNFVMEDGFVSPWPPTSLSPLVLTLVTLNAPLQLV
jgi:hypothetical protein